jgi:hypothetical protein
VLTLRRVLSWYLRLLVAAARLVVVASLWVLGWLVRLLSYDLIHGRVDSLAQLERLLHERTHLD